MAWAPYIGWTERPHQIKDTGAGVRVAVCDVASYFPGVVMHLADAAHFGMNDDLLGGLWLWDASGKRQSVTRSGEDCPVFRTK